jgi:hypothetical protein
MTRHAAIAARPDASQLLAAASATGDGCWNQSASGPVRGNENAAGHQGAPVSALSFGWSHPWNMGASPDSARQPSVQA